MAYFLHLKHGRVIRFWGKVMQRNLSSTIAAWKNGQLAKSRVIHKLSVYSYDFLRKKFRHQEDAASEIFCEVLKRLPRIIDLFSFRGIPFEAYLHISIKKAISSYFRKKKKETTLEKYATESFYENMQEYDPVDQVAEEAPHDSQFLKQYTDKNRKIPQKHQHIQKRILCLACKNAYYIDHRMIGKAARLTGVSEPWLSSIIDHLRNTMENRLQRYKYLSLKKKETLAMTYLMDAEHAECRDGQIHQTKYRRRYNAVSARAKKLNLKLHAISLTPTHQEIAKALKMPKGSVDSGLHYLRKFEIRQDKYS